MGKQMRIKSASLNLILEANGKLTGDQLLAKQRADAEAIRRAEIDALPKYMSRKQRAALRRTLRKGAALEDDA